MRIEKMIGESQLFFSFTYYQDVQIKGSDLCGISRKCGVDKIVLRFNLEI